MEATFLLTNSQGLENSPVCGRAGSRRALMSSPVCGAFLFSGEIRANSWRMPRPDPFRRMVLKSRLLEARKIRKSGWPLQKGNNRKIVGEPGEMFGSVVWSPDGRRLAFVRYGYQPGAYELKL